MAPSNVETLSFRSICIQAARGTLAAKVASATARVIFLGAGEVGGGGRPPFTTGSGRDEIVSCFAFTNTDWLFLSRVNRTARKVFD